MKVPLNSNLFMKYGWDDRLVGKIIEIYGETYLEERENVYESLEDELEDYDINKIYGSTLYHVDHATTIIRLHPDSLNSLLDTALYVLREQNNRFLALKAVGRFKFNSIWDVLEIEVAIKSNRSWHRQLFTVMKNLRLVDEVSLPRDVRGETLIVGRSKYSSIDILWDIYKKTFLFEEIGATNSLKEGLEYLKSLVPA